MSIYEKLWLWLGSGMLDYCYDWLKQMDTHSESGAQCRM